MLADGPAGLVDDHSGGRAQVVQQKVVELELAEEADALLLYSIFSCIFFFFVSPKTHPVGRSVRFD